MAGMEYSLWDVTIPVFLDTLLAAVANLDVVQPQGLRAPLSLWFRATAEQARHEQWTDLTGRATAPAWEAARAVLDHANDKAGS